jgi:branched-chain amino acid transport system substrate-binding protein
VRARWLLSCLPALACLPLAAGCGGVGISGAAGTGNQLAVYSSLPLQGPSAAVSEEIVDGEKLALAEAGGHVGPFRVSFVSLDDSNPTRERWDPGVTATNAKTAAQDSSTIAYLGDYNSAASAVSLPLINAAGILQVSPGSPYVGLTSALDAGQDEPERFYPSGRHTFARLQPGDPVQGAAQVRLMRSLGVRKVYVIDDQDPFEVPLAQIVAGDAEQAGIEVAAHDSIDTAAGTVFAGEVRKVIESGAQAVFFAGGSGPGAVALWQQLHGADPHLRLLGPSTMVNDAFAAQIGAAAASTFLTTPALPAGLYPPPAQRALSDYRRQFGVAGGAYALYGYEAMSAVLLAIRAAGSHGNDRQTVIAKFFAIKDRPSVLGRYSIQADGETTLTRYGVDRIRHGRPMFFRALEAP